MIFTTHSGEETQDLGTRLGRLLSSGDIVLLFGDLGAGKTTLTQGIARGMGVNPDEYVRSPTFTLVNEYAGKFPIYHIDLYRLDSLAEIENIGLEETLFGGGVSIVEWAEKLFRSPGEPPGLGITQRIEVEISCLGENERRLEVRPREMATQSHPIFSLQ